MNRLDHADGRIVQQLEKRLSKELERRPLAAVALTTDSSFLTAQANDVGFDSVFARQIEALGAPGDALIKYLGGPETLAAIKAHCLEPG